MEGRNFCYRDFPKAVQTSVSTMLLCNHIVTPRWGRDMMAEEAVMVAVKKYIRHANLLLFFSLLLFILGFANSNGLRRRSRSIRRKKRSSSIKISIRSRRRRSYRNRRRSRRISRRRIIRIRSNTIRRRRKIHRRRRRRSHSSWCFVSIFWY